MALENEKVLEVKNLRVSFKTNTGTVKAVRGINFNLYKGRTLAIVGESGSGKSVTSKAILGILANNKIVEDGQIIFDGKDLLKISEDKFTQIRGVKISMIFQDPLSSLNPIMKVGKQLTEAMYLKSKASMHGAHALINKFNKVLKKYSDSATFTSLNKAVSSINKDSKVEVLNEFDDLFTKAIQGSISLQKENLIKVKELLVAYKDNYFSSFENFNSHLAHKNLKAIEKAISNSLYALAYEPDDILEVFSVSMQDYLFNYNDSIKRSNAREELLLKNNAKDVYDLPASIRVKEREVIISPKSYFELMIETINGLLNHIDTLISASTDSKDALNQFKNVYFNNILQSKTSMSEQQAKERALELLKEVGINDPERRYNQYPFEFSGGMRQRIVIAIALSSNPEVLICDEPTTALDVTIQSQILELINKLKEEKNLSIIFITHDLGVVANMADDIAVMYAGKIVEYGSVYDIFYDPRHPYTWALLGSMPDLQTKEKLDAIPGTPPNMLLPPRGDAFAARNKYAMEIDYEEQPPFFQISDTHFAATWLCDEDAPDVKAPQIVRDRIKNSLKRNNKNKPQYTLKKNSILETLGGKR